MTDMNLLAEMIQECELMINILSKRLLVLKQLLPGGVSAQNVSGPGVSIKNEMDSHRQSIAAELQKRRTELEDQMQQSIQAMMQRATAPIAPTSPIESAFSKLLENEQFAEMLKKVSSEDGHLLEALKRGDNTTVIEILKRGKS